MKHFLIVSLVSLGLVSSAQADLIIDITEEAGDVKVEWSGTINTAAASFLTTTAAFQLDGIGPNVGFVGHNAGGNIDIYDTNVNWALFGTGGGEAFDSSSGSGFALFSAPQIALPAGYTNGVLSGMGTFNGDTFLSLGLNPGSYVTTFSNGNFSDTVTVNVVPEPSSLALLGIGSIALVGYRVRRKKQSA